MQNQALTLTANQDDNCRNIWPVLIKISVFLVCDMSNLYIIYIIQQSHSIWVMYHDIKKQHLTNTQTVHEDLFLFIYLFKDLVKPPPEPKAHECVISIHQVAGKHIVVLFAE